jgi:hypothetical protein
LIYIKALFVIAVFKIQILLVNYKRQWRATMRSWTIVVVAAVVVAPMSWAWADGALAVGGGQFGFSRNHETMKHAVKLALDNCGNSKCRIEMTFRNSCVAYASASNGIAGWARRDSERAARRAAMKNCDDAGGRDCAVRANEGYECDGL